MTDRKKIVFEKNQSYHILTRTVEKRKIFIEYEECYRFIFQMYAANIGRPTFNLHRKDIIKAAQALLNGEEISEKFITTDHPPLVHFLSFVEVIDHYHFNLVPNLENGISKYMQKLNGGFAKYFNLRHNRNGNLFEKPYKVVPIKNNFQQDAILRYINVKNPLDVFYPRWVERGLKDEKAALRFLNEYQFSSFPDLFGKRNSRILASRSELEKYLGEEITKDQLTFVNFARDYLRKKLVLYNSIFLE